MPQCKRNPLQSVVGVVCGFILLALAGLVIVTIRVLMADHGPQRVRQIQEVRLITQPPPKIPEKTPEPKQEVQKQEIIEPEPEPEEAPPLDQANTDDSQENAATDDNLGLDADGTAGSDAFGLLSKKGGRSILIGGDSHGCPPMKKFAWYTRMIEGEIKKRIMIQGGEIPKGKLQVLLKIVLDVEGKVINYRIYDFSGNDYMDKAVKLAMEKMHAMSEPPPEGMPRSINLRISLTG
ncbi:MAG: TonB C-terminal domain-containing protein [bacterium]